MTFKTKKTITGAKNGRVSQLSKNERNINTAMSKAKRKRPRLVLNFDQYTELVDKLNNMIKRTHPEWTQKQVEEKISETFSRKKNYKKK